MFNLKNQVLFHNQSSLQLSEYITAIQWSKKGHLAMSSAKGEVLIKDESTQLILTPADTQGKSINCLAFSGDGNFLAVGGQDGKVRIWQISPQISLIEVIELGKHWLEHLAWHPSRNILAVSAGSSVQVWDAVRREIVMTLPLAISTVLSLAWHPQENALAVGGNGKIKVWNLDKSGDEPIFLETLAAITKIAFSWGGEYLAAVCLDHTVLVWSWGQKDPWRMTGFGAKVRNLAWSELKSGSAPLLAVSSYGDILVWKKEENDADGWIAYTLNQHQGVIVDLSFQPDSFLLASVDEEGGLFLWKKAKQLAQSLTSVNQGFSCLSWHPDGKKIATGGEAGEVNIWVKSQRGQGFA